MMNQNPRRSIVDELAATTLAVVAADQAHLQHLMESAPLRGPAGRSETGLANRRPEPENIA